MFPVTVLTKLSNMNKAHHLKHKYFCDIIDDKFGLLVATSCQYRAQEDFDYFRFAAVGQSLLWREGGGGQAYSWLPTCQNHITDYKLDSMVCIQVYEGVGVVWAERSMSDSLDCQPVDSILTQVSRKESLRPL